MAVIEYDEYKQKLLALEPTLGELEKALASPKPARSWPSSRRRRSRTASGTTWSAASR